MSKINILIVEDEAIVARDIQQSLRKSGYNVTEIVASGEMALKSIAEFQPDLIMLDIMLKGSMSGVDVSEVVKKNYNIPVIFLTAYADQSTLERAKVTEPFGYIIKPFKEIDLHTTIEMALYKHKKILDIKTERDLYHSLIVETKSGGKDIHFLKSNSKLIKLKTEDIWFVEALKDYVIVHTTKAKFTIHSTMKEIEAKLSSTVFLRVHRSFIVQLSKIHSIEANTIVLENDKKIIPIGGSYRDSLLESLNLF